MDDAHVGGDTTHMSPTHMSIIHIISTIHFHILNKCKIKPLKPPMDLTSTTVSCLWVVGGARFLTEMSLVP